MVTGSKFMILILRVTVVLLYPVEQQVFSTGFFSAILTKYEFHFYALVSISTL